MFYPYAMFYPYTMRFRLPFDVVIHVHQIADRVRVVRDVAVAPDRVFDDAACHGEVDHIHRRIFVYHRIDQSAGKSVSAAYPVEDRESK